MNLNKKQIEAVNHINGPLLIVAGAGSGKTTVLSYRATEMKKSNINPENILCVTFTNKAVNELKHRIVNQLGQTEGEKVYISTFHGLGLDILRTYLKKDFSVTHTHQSRQLVKKIIEEKNDYSDELKNFLKPNTVMKLISLFKSEAVYPEFLYKGEPLKEWIDGKKIKEFLKEEIKTKENYEAFKEIYAKYQKRLHEENLIDVDDILLHTVKLLVKSEKVLNELQERFKYIMVDEYQDTNRVQYILIKLLAEKYKNLAVVGDDFQSIYKFRGSDIRNILNFHNDYPEAKEILLEENYRSTKTILTAANQIIANNPDQKEKELYTSKEQGEKIKYHEAEFALDEAEFVADEIEKLIESGEFDYRDIAVFYRNNADSSVFETVLPKRDIPFAISSDSSFFERKEIKDVLNYLQFILNPTNEFLFTQVINYPKRGVGNTTIARIVQNAKGQDLKEYCKNPVDVKLNKNAEAGLKFFVKVIEKFQKHKDKVSAHRMIEQLIKDIDYKSTFEDLETYLKKEKEDYLNKLVDISREMEMKKGSTMLLEEFLQQLLKTDVDATMTEEEFNRVNLLTVHSAKGLEFPVVFIVGMKEEGFPSKYAVTDKAIEEERRLVYVAFTRAMKELTVTFPKKSIVKDEENPKEKKEIVNKKSRFLSEFDQNLIEII